MNTTARKPNAFHILECFLIAALIAAPLRSEAQGQAAAEKEVRSLMTDFIEAFDNLDWPAFRKLWVDDPVLFHPNLSGNPTGRRVEGAADFEKSWKGVFDGIRQNAASRGVTKAPYQNIQPQDLRIDFPAPTVAVVTFHLGVPNITISRRMFVVVKTPAGWKISHLHGSNMSLKSPQ